MTVSAASSKDVKPLEALIVRLKEELEKKNAEVKLTYKNTLKICDFILSRVVYPDSVRESIKEMPKSKAAIECVAYMGR
jgi:hypothetical protein